MLALIEEQLADGFTEVSAPPWRAFLDQLVAFWEEDDPSFDTAGLRDAILASRAPRAAEIVDHLAGLADRWVAQPDGSSRMDMDDASQARHTEWLTEHADASLPALFLGLRHPDYGAQLLVEGVLVRLGRREVLPSLMSVIVRPAANLAPHLGGRPQHFPVDALSRLGPPPPDVAGRLVEALDHGDSRVAAAAAAVIAEHVTDDALFEPLLACAGRAKKNDGFAWAMMRAAEVRRDPRIPSVPRVDATEPSVSCGRLSGADPGRAQGARLCPVSSFGELRQSGGEASSSGGCSQNTTHVNLPKVVHADYPPCGSTGGRGPAGRASLPPGRWSWCRATGTARSGAPRRNRPPRGPAAR